MRTELALKGFVALTGFSRSLLYAVAVPAQKFIRTQAVPSLVPAKQAHGIDNPPTAVSNLTLSLTSVCALPHK